MKKFISILLIAVTLLGLTACQSNDPAASSSSTPPAAPKELVLSTVYTNITAKATMPEMMRVEEDLLLDLYGIKAEQYKQVEIYLCVNSLRADEIWLIEAVDEAALAQLNTLAQNRLTAKDEESITYSPEQNAIVKKAHLETYGNYLVMIVSPDVETLTAAFKTEAGV